LYDGWIVHALFETNGLEQNVKSTQHSVGHARVFGAFLADVAGVVHNQEEGADHIHYPQNFNVFQASSANTTLSRLLVSLNTHLVLLLSSSWQMLCNRLWSMSSLVL